jgi:hypothetical protein
LSLPTRGRFAQVLAVLRALHLAGGQVKTWEWNLLLDCAGKEGWRRPREEQFRVALALLAEMRHRPYHHNYDQNDDSDGDGGTGTIMDSSFMTGGQEWGAEGDWSAGAGAAPALDLEPDIISYTTLLAHAVRTRLPAAVRHATQLLSRAGLAPGVHAHTALLCFFAQRGDLAGVRDMLLRLRRCRVQQQQRRRRRYEETDVDMATEMDTGLTQVPFNAVLWAFAYNGRLDVARAMYRVAEAAAGGRTTEEEAEKGGEDGERDGEELEELESEIIVVAATYRTLILAYAYHGDLRACLETFSNMLSASSSSPSPSPSPTSTTTEAETELNEQGEFVVSLAAFRSIFLGFTPHGIANITQLSTQTHQPLLLYRPPRNGTTITTNNNNNAVAPLITLSTPATEGAAATTKSANGPSRRSTCSLCASLSCPGTCTHANRRSSGS